MMKFKKRHGFTITEVMMAAFISTAIALALISSTIMLSHIIKSVRSQQRFSMMGKKAIEHINREIRMAETPLSVRDDGGSPALQGNQVFFERIGESTGRRSITLTPGDDGEIDTPWDNQLIFDPDTSTGGDEVVIVDSLAPSDGVNAFRYNNATTPLVVQIRVGDPVVEDEPKVSDSFSGRDMQGFEINITVAPRN